jgi:hypothetical protein
LAPTQEERIAALERLTRGHQQAIKEHRSVLQSLTYDMTAIQEFAFDQSDVLQKVSDDLNFVKKATKDDIANMATKDDIANMATKDDIANMATNLRGEMVAMENRILHAVQQLVTIVSTQRPQSE